MDKQYLIAFAEGPEPVSEDVVLRTEQLVKHIDSGSRFSIASFVGGPVYWAYRKCYKEAIGLFVGWIVACSLALFAMMPVLATILQFFSAAFFYKMYSRRAESCLREIRKNTPCINSEETALLMREAGGVNERAAAWMVVALAALCVLIFYCSYVLYG